MADYIEYQDLKVRVNTSDVALSSYTSGTRKVKTIDPLGNRVDFSGASAAVEDATYLAADIPPATLLPGWWRFAAEAVDLLGKVRKTVWHKLYVKREGEV